MLNNPKKIEEKKDDIAAVLVEGAGGIPHDSKESAVFFSFLVQWLSPLYSEAVYKYMGDPSYSCSIWWGGGGRGGGKFTFLSV
jgi:hypothetical protein